MSAEVVVRAQKEKQNYGLLKVHFKSTYLLSTEPSTFSPTPSLGPLDTLTGAGGAAGADDVTGTLWGTVPGTSSFPCAGRHGLEGSDASDMVLQSVK